MGTLNVGTQALRFAPKGAGTLVNLGNQTVYIDTVTPNANSTPIAPLGGITLDGTQTYFLQASSGVQELAFLSGMTAYLPSTVQISAILGTANVAVTNAPNVGVPGGVAVTNTPGVNVSNVPGVSAAAQQSVLATGSINLNSASQILINTLTLPSWVKSIGIITTGINGGSTQPAGSYDFQINQGGVGGVVIEQDSVFLPQINASVGFNLREVFLDVPDSAFVDVLWNSPIGAWSIGASLTYTIVGYGFPVSQMRKNKIVGKSVTAATAVTATTSGTAQLHIAGPPFGQVLVVDAMTFQSGSAASGLFLGGRSGISNPSITVNIPVGSPNMPPYGPFYFFEDVMVWGGANNGMIVRSHAHLEFL